MPKNRFITPELKAHILFVYFQNLKQPMSEIALLCQCYLSIVDQVVSDYIKGDKKESFIILESRLNFYDLKSLQ